MFLYLSCACLAQASARTPWPWSSARLRSPALPWPPRWCVLLVKVDYYHLHHLLLQQPVGGRHSLWEGLAVTRDLVCRRTDSRAPSGRRPWRGGRAWGRRSSLPHPGRRVLQGRGWGGGREGEGWGGGGEEGRLVYSGWEEGVLETGSGGREVHEGTRTGKR